MVQELKNSFNGIANTDITLKSRKKRRQENCNTVVEIESRLPNSHDGNKQKSLLDSLLNQGILINVNDTGDNLLYNVEICKQTVIINQEPDNTKIELYICKLERSDDKNQPILHLVMQLKQDSFASLMVKSQLDFLQKDLTTEYVFRLKSSSGYEAIERILENGTICDVFSNNIITPFYKTVRDSCHSAGNIFKPKGPDESLNDNSIICNACGLAKCDVKQVWELLLKGDSSNLSNKQNTPLFVAVDEIWYTSTDEWNSIRSEYNNTVQDTSHFIRESYSTVHKKFKRLILRHGTNIKINPGRTFVYHAIEEGELLLADYIIQSSVTLRPMDLKTNVLNTTKKHSSYYDNIIDFFVDVNIIRPEDVHDVSLLFNAAVFGGRVDIVKYLTERGHDVNVKDSAGMTALQSTAHFCRPYTSENSEKIAKAEIASILLNLGALVDVRNKGFTTFEFALLDECTELLKVLLLHKADTTRMHVYTDRMYFNNLEHHLYELDGVNPHNHTLTDRYMLKHLLPPCRGERRSSALEVAVVLGKQSCLEALLNTGMNADHKNRKGLNLLHSAVLSCSKSRVFLQILLDHGANINLKDKNRMTALSFAYRTLQLDVFKFLLDNWAEPFIGSKSWCRYSNYFSTGLKRLGNPLKSKRIVKNMNKTLFEHHIKLRVADLSPKDYLNKAFPDPITPNFEDNCEIEVSMMMSEKVGDMEITFYDVLRSSSSQLVAFWKNEGFQAVVKAGEWRKKYPIYEKMIDSKLSAAENRFILLNESSEIFREVLCPLPDVCQAKIVNFFTDYELRRLVYLSEMKFLA